MSSDLRELYQEVILDHGKRPRNRRKMEDADRAAVGYNPLCGDKLTLYLKLEDGVVSDAAFEGVGCAISMASASLATEHLRGLTADEAQRVFDHFTAMVTAPTDQEPDTEGMGKLAVFAGVRGFPARVKCASLAWHTVQAALHGDRETVTTE